MPRSSARSPSPGVAGRSSAPVPPPSRPPYATSLSSSATTHASHLHFSDPPPFIVTRSDLRDSLTAYETLLSTAKAFRLAVMGLSAATAQFATALEGCARTKGAQGWSGYEGRKKAAGKGKAGAGLVPGFDVHGDEISEEEAQGLSAAERLLAASGLHFLTANHEQVLADTFYKSFEIPLLDAYDSHRQAIADRQTSYDADLSVRTRRIRETEARNTREGRKRVRDLGAFRKNLRELQGQVDEVERVKQEYYREVAESEHDIWEEVTEKRVLSRLVGSTEPPIDALGHDSQISLVVRSEVDLFDRVASKGASDPTLEAMLTAIPDPFDSFTPRPSGNAPLGVPSPEIYSILPPLGVGSSASSSSSRERETLTPAQAIARDSMLGVVPDDHDPFMGKGDKEDWTSPQASSSSPPETPKANKTLPATSSTTQGPVRPPPDVISSTLKKATAAPAKTSPLRDSWTPDSFASVSSTGSQDSVGKSEEVPPDDEGYESGEEGQGGTIRGRSDKMLA